jgi:hypothetical protein
MRYQTAIETVVLVAGFNSLRLLTKQFWTLANPRSHQHRPLCSRQPVIYPISTILLGPERISNLGSDDSLFNFARWERLSTGDRK